MNRLSKREACDCLEAAALATHGGILIGKALVCLAALVSAASIARGDTIDRPRFNFEEPRPAAVQKPSDTQAPAETKGGTKRPEPDAGSPVFIDPEPGQRDVSDQAKYKIDARPVVYWYSEYEDIRQCPPCLQVDDVSRLPECPFRFEKRDCPAWVKSSPTLHYQGADGAWYKSEGWTGILDFYLLYRTRNPEFALMAKAQSIGASPLDQIQKFAGTGGRFEFTPDKPIKAVMDDGTSVSYSTIKGRYQIVNGLPRLVLDAPLPQVSAKKFFLHFGAVVQGADYQPTPPPAGSVGIQTNRGRFVVKMEAVK